MLEYKHVLRNGVSMYAIYRKIFLQNMRCVKIFLYLRARKPLVLRN